MPRLKNRNHMVPHGFDFVWPATGWSARKLMPHRSFNDVVMALASHVKANPHQAAQSGMPSDYDSLAIRVEEQTVKTLARAGFNDFIQQDAEIPKWTPPQPLPARPQPSQPSVVGAGVKTVAGVQTYLDWLGEGGQPVTKKLATERGAICLQCPQNKKGDWKTFFTEQVSSGIMKMFGMIHDLKLETQHDEKLGVCDICLCPLKAKVWAPLTHIKRNIPEKVLFELPGFCWIKKEEE